MIRLIILITLKPRFFVGVDEALPLVFEINPVAGSQFNVSDIINVSANVTVLLILLEVSFAKKVTLY